MFSTKGRTDGSYLNITDLDVLPFTGLEAATYLEFCQTVTSFCFPTNCVCIRKTTELTQKQNNLVTYLFAAEQACSL